MAVISGTSALGSSASRHFLLGGWRDVVEDVRRLSADLHRSPDICACGHTASGSGGTCLCCQTGVSQTDCSDCGAQVSALGQRLDTLIDDSLRFLPVIAELLEWHAATRESAQLHSIRVQIGTVERTFRRLATASAEFGRDCSGSHIKEMAPLVGDLLREIWVLEKALEPSTRKWAELRKLERERKGTDEYQG